ncbi:MAG: nucleotide disphospho-sugar-binding domain-containing protein [Actinomycetota bacterium]
MPDGRTIVFFPEPGAWGPTNNCVAIAEVLKERGHRVVFVVDISFEGVLEEKGYEERAMRMAPAEEGADPTDDPWAEFIRVTAPEFRKPPIEQQATVTKPIWEALVAGEQYSHDRLMEIWEDVRPDVVCTDNVTGFPAIELAGCPWARFVSANPLEMRDRDLPPPLSGLPAANRSQWEAFRIEYHRVHEDLLAEHNEFRRSVGVDPCPPDEFNTHSNWLNLYLFPEAADYDRAEPLDPIWHRLESTVRTGEPSFDVDAHVPGEGKLIYLSLGSLGCMDVGLMQRLIDALAETDHRTIVSMGPLKDQMKLGPNMYGDQFLPQPSILPQCDLLITHGGNNTTCEGFHYGLPMIGLPLFWDQYDNAQRLQETGFGRRLPTYDWTSEQLLGAVAKLLADETLATTMRTNAEAIRSDPGRVTGADLLERLAITGEPVTD